MHFVTNWEIFLRQFFGLAQDISQIVHLFLIWLLTCLWLWDWLRLHLWNWCLRFLRLDVVCWFLVCLDERLSNLALIRPGHLGASTNYWCRRRRERASLSMMVWVGIIPTWNSPILLSCGLTWCLPWAHVQMLVARGHHHAVRCADGLLC